MSLLPDQPPMDRQLWVSYDAADWQRLSFDWLRWSGLVAIKLALLRGSPELFREHPSVRVSALSGLMNRCSRLSLAILKLTGEARHGEAAAILARCVMESAVRICWLASGKRADAFDRYLADGLRQDLRLQERLQENIDERKGATLPVEERMLASIRRCMALAGLDEAAVRSTKPLPDLRSIIVDLGLAEEAYVGVQRMGSHAVHGTWTDLLEHYLELESGQLELRDNDSRLDCQVYDAMSLFVLEACVSFLAWRLTQSEEREGIEETLRTAQATVSEVFHARHADDYCLQADGAHGAPGGAND